MTNAHCRDETFSTVDRDIAAVLFADGVHDGEAKSCSAGLSRTSFIGAKDSFEEVTNKDVNDIGNTVQALVPDMLNGHVSGEDEIHIFHQVLRQGVLLGGKLDAFTGTAYLLRKTVEFQVGDGQRVGSVYWSSTQKRLATHQYFSKG